jgi:DNA-binding GntR family transcriptional regulator
MSLSNINLTFVNNSISENVYASLKRAIVRGELPPGNRLRVLDIANKFDISQAPVREALERLKQEGLVVGKPNKGSAVSDITLKEIRDIYALRLLVEGFVIRETMSRLDQELLDQLEQIMANMRKAADEDEAYDMVEWDMAFHGFFYKHSNNDQLNDIWNNITVKIARFIAVTNSIYSKELLIEGHAELLRIVKSGDAELLVNKLSTTFQAQIDICDSMQNGEGFGDERKLFFHK